MCRNVKKDCICEYLLLLPTNSIYLWNEDGLFLHFINTKARRNQNKS